MSEGTAVAVPSRPTTYTRESRSHEGSAWPLQRGVHALHTVFLFRLSPKVAKNPRYVQSYTLVCHLKKVMHRGWASFQARLAFTMAAFNVLVQWHGFQPNASGFVPLSMAEFSL